VFVGGLFFSMNGYQSVFTKEERRQKQKAPLSGTSFLQMSEEYLEKCHYACFIRFFDKERLGLWDLKLK
jgi:hypothetical protein